MLWRDAYGKDRRKPGLAELRSYWPGEIADLFEELSAQLARRYGLSLTHPRYTKEGWKYQYTKKNVPLLTDVAILPDGFRVQGVEVRDAAGIQEALAVADGMHDAAFLARYEEAVAQRNAAQAERSRQRAERERAEQEIFLQKVSKDRLNQFRWSPKVPRETIRRLYQSHAQGRLDETLLDDVGIAIYLRCLQGRDERLLADVGKLKCHGCGAILSYENEGKLLCECGQGYIFREYMRSFNRNSMPSRSGTAVFNEFLQRWPSAHTPNDKMLLLDWLIHQCHLNLLSGVKRDFLGVNLIEGSKKQVGELIEQLAYE